MAGLFVIFIIIVVIGLIKLAVINHQEKQKNETTKQTRCNRCGNTGNLIYYCSERTWGNHRSRRAISMTLCQMCYDTTTTRNIRLLKSMPYKDYLFTEHWDDIRWRELHRVLYKCQLCGGKQALVVHHENYRSRGEESSKDLVVVCADCHDKIHNREAS